MRNLFIKLALNTKPTLRLRMPVHYLPPDVGCNLEIVPIIGIFVKISVMNKNTSILLGEHFDSFVQGSISKGRFKNVSEVIRAGLRLLEEEENKVAILKSSIQEGIDSGIAHDFDPETHLESLKANQ